MQVIIDRFEGNLAVVEIEKNKFAKIPDALIPDAKEGDTVKITAGKTSQFFVGSRDDNFVYVLTPGGKYALTRELSDGAKPGDSLCIEVDSVAVEIRQSKIQSLMKNLFE